MKNPLFLGIDIGTQGVHVVVADTTGGVLADASREFAQVAISGLPSGYMEQNPDDWWKTVSSCLRQVVLGLRKRGHAPDEIVAGAVDSISGTVVLLDEDNHPLRPAVRHDDGRALVEADEVNNESTTLRKKLGFCFDSSYALPKILWLARHEPEILRRTRCATHAAGYIVGKLTDLFCVTDQNNAFKTGFDLLDFSWPSFIESKLGIDTCRLPWVLRSGETIYHVSEECAEETGLAETTRIVAGMTAASANQIASGTRHIGDWNTLLGTTFVFKGLTKELLIDPRGRVYSLLHPLGYWMPSTSINIGLHTLDRLFTNMNKGGVNLTAFSPVPTSLMVNPLTGKGERFSFDRPDVESIIKEKAQSEQELYVAHLEETAYVERLIYGVLRSLGAEIRERIYTTGNGAENLEWMQIRADVLGMECARATHATAAMGSAIIAASRTLFDSIEEAGAQMVRLDRVISPRPHMVLRYANSYPAFLDACRHHGFVNDLEKVAS
jgi:sugar (pentulose or hexulose) kinase